MTRLLVLAAAVLTVTGLFVAPSPRVGNWPLAFGVAGLLGVAFFALVTRPEQRRP